MITKIRDYSIVKKIGEGGMGSVYLAEDTMLERKVAIKILNQNLTTDQQFIDRFLKEAKVQASLVHPNIVALYNFFREDANYCMVMEFASGETLRDLIRRVGPIYEERALKIFRQILDGVGYAHSRGIVHRDIKPSNIIVDGHDNVKVMDFGIAKIMGDRGMTKTGMKMGTILYMSPEQVRAEKDIDQRTDIFSLGITFYEMLTGRVPYNTETESDFELMNEIVSREIKDPREFYPYVSDKSISIIYSMTEKDKNKRIHDTADVYESIGIYPPQIVKRGIEIVTGNEIMDVWIDGKAIGKKTPCVLDRLGKGQFKLELISETCYSLPELIDTNKQGEEILIKPNIKRFGSFVLKSRYTYLQFSGLNDIVYSLKTNYKVKAGNYKLHPSQSYLPDLTIEIKEGEEKIINYDQLINPINVKIVTGSYEGQFNLTGIDMPLDETFYATKEFSVLPGNYKVSGLSNKLKIEKPYGITEQDHTIDLGFELKRLSRKRKQKTIGIIASIILPIIIVALIIGIPIINENNMWVEAKAKNTTDSYGEYLRMYPDGKYVNEARSFKEESMWVFAKNKNDERSYTEYLNEYPQGRYASQISEYREPLMYSRVITENMEASFNDYLNEYPNGKYIQTVMKKREPLMWERVKAQKSEDAINSYLYTYPNGLYTAQAQKLKDEILWEKTMGSLAEDKTKWEIRKELVFGDDGEPTNSLIASIIERIQSNVGIGSPVSKEEFQRLFDRPESKVVYADNLIRYATPMSKEIQTQEHEDYTKIFMKEKRQVAGVEFLKNYNSLLSQAENEYGVLKRDLVSILMWESGLGEFTGNFQIFNILMEQILFMDVAQVYAVKEMSANGEDNPLLIASKKAAEEKRLQNRKNDAARNLVSLLRECKANELDPLLLKGSWGGAIGYVQFMPYNLKYTVDGDNNGTKDLFSWPDAIMSASNYLKNVGGYNSTEEGRKRAIKKYNSSDSYVSGVMLYADTIWDRYLREN